MMHVPLLLIALAVGYWVLTLSQSQQKPLDIVGRIVGGIILLAALASLICGAFCQMRGMSCGGGSCSYKAAGCPMSSHIATDKVVEEKK